MIDCVVGEGYVSIESHHNGYLVELQSNKLVASAEVRAEKFLQGTGIFDGSGLPLMETRADRRRAGSLGWRECRPKSYRSSVCRRAPACWKRAFR